MVPPGRALDITGHFAGCGFPGIVHRGALEPASFRHAPCGPRQPRVWVLFWSWPLPFPGVHFTQRYTTLLPARQDIPSASAFPRTLRTLTIFLARDFSQSIPRTRLVINFLSRSWSQHCVVAPQLTPVRESHSLCRGRRAASSRLSVAHTRLWCARRLRNARKYPPF